MGLPRVSANDIMASMFDGLSGFGAAENGGGTSLSNTVCINDPLGQWLTVHEKVLKFTDFGDIARIDASLALALKRIVITFFDVRGAQRVLLDLGPGVAEPFPPAVHDCRAVRVNLAGFAERAGTVGGFQRFGEVASLTMCGGDAVVEFYDMRSAHALLVAAAGSAQPVPMIGETSQQLPSVAAPSPPLWSGDLFPAEAPGGAVLEECEAPEDTNLWAGAVTTRFAASDSGLSGARSSMSMTPSTHATRSGSSSSGGKPSTDSSGSDKDKAVNRPIRTKVSNTDFSKYDICSEKIKSGEDSRSTVMVRNLNGPQVRSNFLSFLETCGLQDRYSFFYMPCKEHRNVPAGFAFVNFLAAGDVLVLHESFSKGAWQRHLGNKHKKTPGLSYARFQGHEELVKHFTQSAVLYEQDPEKRPVFKHTDRLGRLQPSMLPSPQLPEAQESEPLDDADTEETTSAEDSKEKTHGDNAEATKPKGLPLVSLAPRANQLAAGSRIRGDCPAYVMTSDLLSNTAGRRDAYFCASLQSELLGVPYDAAMEYIDIGRMSTLQMGA